MIPIKLCYFHRKPCNKITLAYIAYNITLKSEMNLITSKKICVQLINICHAYIGMKQFYSLIRRNKIKVNMCMFLLGSQWYVVYYHNMILPELSI